MTRQRAAAAAEQLAALQAAAEDMQLARDSEQLAIALALSQTGSGLAAQVPQVSLNFLKIGQPEEASVRNHRLVRIRACMRRKICSFPA